MIWGLSKRRFALLYLLAATACAEREGTTHAPGIMTVVAEPGESSWVRNFNPLMFSTARWPTLGGIYEPLMTYNMVEGKYVPLLATGYHWEDGARRLVFSIRKGVRWSDGKPFTARDVEFTFGLLKKFRALDNQGAWQKYRAITATDDYTVVVEFKEPYVPGLFMAMQPAIVPEHVWKDIEDPVKFANENPVGTGPLTEVTSFQTQVYQVEKNPYYWDPGKPKIKGVKMPAFPSNDQSVLALIHGDIDWIGAFIPAIDRVFVEKDPEHHGYYFAKVEGTVMLYTNTTKKPFDDVNVRKALSMAIDRKKIVKVAMHDYTRPADATGLTDLYKSWRSQEAVKAGTWVHYEPEKAARLLDAAGIQRADDGMRHLANGEPFELDVNCVAGWSDWIVAAQIIVRNFRALGIDASLKTYGFSTWFQRLRSGDYDLSMSWSSGDDTPYGFYRRQMSSDTVLPLGELADLNWQRFSDPEVDALLHEFEKTVDEKRRREISDALQMRFVELAPSIPLFLGNAFGEYNTKRFTGFPTQDNPYAPLSPHKIAGLPNYALVLKRLEPR